MEKQQLTNQEKAMVLAELHQAISNNDGISAKKLISTIDNHDIIVFPKGKRPVAEIKERITAKISNLLGEDEKKLRSFDSYELLKLVGESQK